jgi:hypothetical protein
MRYAGTIDECEIDYSLQSHADELAAFRKKRLKAKAIDL